MQPEPENSMPGETAKLLKNLENKYLSLVEEAKKVKAAIEALRSLEGVNSDISVDMGIKAACLHVLQDGAWHSNKDIEAVLGKAGFDSKNLGTKVYVALKRMEDKKGEKDPVKGWKKS